MYRSNFQEERRASASSKGGSKLQAVFSKISGMLPKADDLGASATNKAMSKDIIESVLADSPIPVPTNWNNYEPCCISVEERGCLTISTITQRLEMELRTAKRTHLACGEVLLPCGLLFRVARDILSMAESEPCGIRGCIIYLNYETVNVCRKLTSIKCDPSTATTFELNLTLQQTTNGYWNFLPQFLKNLGRGGTIVISPAYTLSKRKLYRSNLVE